MISRLLLCLTALGLSLASAQPLRVLVHDSFDLSVDLIASFTEETGIEVEVLPAGDAGEVLTRAILTRHQPIADLLFGVDPGLLPRALEAGLFQPYRSPELAHVPEHLDFDASGHVNPVDVGYVLFNLDQAWFEENGLQPPTDISELTDARFADLVAVTDPASSSPGMAFLLTTIARFGEDGYLDFWQGLRENGLLVASGWTEAYYTAFTRYGGDRPIVLSYATSPAAEVIFAEETLDEAPTANLLCPECAYRQIEGVAILRGTDKAEEAAAFIDFLLSPEVQAGIPTSMFVYPARSAVPLPPEFERFADEPAPEETAEVPAGLIADRQDEWLRDWTEVVLRGRDARNLR